MATIDKIFYQYINNVVIPGILPATKFAIGNAKGLTPPYIVMMKIIDPETHELLATDQGNEGRAVFQFSGYMGPAGNAATTVEYLNNFKEIIKNIVGIIGTTDLRKIYYNKTEGVRLLGDGSSEIWGAMFETTIYWIKP